MADYAISNVPRRVVYTASGVGPYAFTFEILVNTDVAVYKDDALLTLTTDYTVTIASNGTGSITLVASPTGATQIAIVGSRAIQRTSDFVTGGDFFANTVNNELDSLTIFAQQNAEAVGRALQAPQTDPTNIDMTLPRASVRANKTLAFDANGDPTTGEVIGDNRGNWASGTTYNKRDIVKDTSNGNVYYANTSHTSSGSQPISSNADSAKWDLLVDNASASTSASAAATSATAAAGSATSAATSATNAASSASAASTSASGVATSATNAASSATAASGSASTASTQATNASNSATAAATSATNAASSATAAASSATSASNSASTATTQASNAATSATNAATSASTATTQASNAATSATAAAGSATAAAGSATSAAGSATTATTQATNASSSATAAASSAASAAASLDSFDDRYLGSKSSDPTVDNDGNALVTGALYYNSTVQAMKVYDGAAWITATAAGTSAMSRYRYVATAGQTTFSGADANALTLSYTSGNIVVVRNGATLEPAEYTASNGTSIVLAVAAAAGDVVDVVAFKSFTVSDTYSKAQADALLASKQPLNSNLTTYAATGVGFRNRIINGDMRIDQRNNGASVTPINGAYTLDRWSCLLTQASKYTAQQNAGSVTPPVGFSNYLGITSSSAYSVVSSDYFSVIQKIEGFNSADFGWGTANAQAVTLSFWVRSSLTGTFGGAFTNATTNRSYPFTYTISAANTWEQKTVTVAGDTSGTWVGATNGSGILVVLGLGTGSTFSGTAGAWAAGNFFSATGAVSVVGTSGATFYITGVQLEAGSVASPFERRPYGTEVQLCQRYYCKTFSQDVAPVQNQGGTGSISFISQAAQLWDAMWRFPVEMRNTPTTITTYSTNAASANWSTNTDTPVASIGNSGSSGLTVRASTPAAAGRAYSIHISASAEL